MHGALCVSYSGQCFSSEAWGGRSANRGQCAQACRLPYEMLVDGRVEPLGDARYLLSPGDLYALEQVPEIVRIGISALKIEGRYKDAEYVALTTRAYRKAVDDAWAGRGAAGRIAQREGRAGTSVFARAGSVLLNGDQSPDGGARTRAPASRTARRPRDARFRGQRRGDSGIRSRRLAPEAGRWNRLRCRRLAQSRRAGRRRPDLSRAAGGCRESGTILRERRGEHLADSPRRSGVAHA